MQHWQYGLEERRYLKDGAKTETGTREIPINDLARAVLEEAVKKAPRNKLGLLFFDINKKGLITTQQVNCYFRRVCKKADVELRGQHSRMNNDAMKKFEDYAASLVG